MASTNDVISVRNGPALLITFNRPESKNALSLDMLTQLVSILKNATVDRSVRAIMINGSGKNFMAGTDMTVYKGDFTNALDHANNMIMPYHAAIRELQAMDKPVLASVEGTVYGAGLSFMLASDLVIASRSTKFCTKYSESALSPDGGCSYFLPRKVGLAKATELLMLNKEITAEEAQNIGLINFVVEDWTLQHDSMTLLMNLAEAPTRALGSIKKLLNSSFANTLDQQLGIEHTSWGQISRSFDFMEFLRATSTGRSAKFTGS